MSRKILEPGNPYSVFITGIPQFIYSYGVYGYLPSRAYLVKLTSDSNRLGDRPSRVTEILFTHICRTLNIEHECINLDELKLVATTENDILDIQLINRMALNATKKPKILAAQSEYVNLMRPNLFSFKLQSLKLRVDLTKSLLVPMRLTKFYTLAPKAKRSLFLTEKILDWSAVDRFSDACFKSLLNHPSWLFLTKIHAELKNADTLIVFPLAVHFGGNSQINTQIIESAIEYARAESILNVLVKNHPSDPEDYSSLVADTDIRIEYFYDELERSVPTEILVNAFKSVSFFGFESTTFLSLQHRVKLSSHVVEIENHKEKNYRKYLLGEIRNLYPHTKSLIKY